MGNIDLIQSLKFLPGILLGLTVHEFSHAWMASQCGDSTAKDMGRVSLNPIRHIDPLGFLVLLVAGFGWAKPVQFNEKNLHNPGVDVIKIALAGPFSNALLAILLSVLFNLTFTSPLSSQGPAMNIIIEIFIYAIYINWGLFIFNLLPIPPLDGSHLFFFPLRKYTNLYVFLYRYGMWALFLIIILERTMRVNLLPIGPAMNYLFHMFVKIG